MGIRARNTSTGRMSNLAAEHTESAGTPVKPFRGHLSCTSPVRPGRSPVPFRAPPAAQAASVCPCGLAVFRYRRDRAGQCWRAARRAKWPPTSGSFLDRPSDQIIWIAEQGPGGGGGGGGNQMKEPPRRAELLARPSSPFRSPSLRSSKCRRSHRRCNRIPSRSWNIPAGSHSVAAEALQGLIDAQPRPATPSQGLGSGGGAGTAGEWYWSGTGSGLGPGSGGGTGGGVYHPGSGVTTPIALNSVKPRTRPRRCRARSRARSGWNASFSPRACAPTSRSSVARSDLRSL